MGIVNVNMAICDICGKRKTSQKKQTEFLKQLRAQGWQGSLATIRCPDCLKKEAPKSESPKSSSQARVFYGRPVQILLLGGSYFIRISSAAGSGEVNVYIPYEQIAPLNANTLPSLSAVRHALGEDKVAYRIRRREYIGGRCYLVANVCDREGESV